MHTCVAAGWSHAPAGRAEGALPPRRFPPAGCAACGAAGVAAAREAGPAGRWGIGREYDERYDESGRLHGVGSSSASCRQRLHTPSAAPLQSSRRRGGEAAALCRPRAEPAAAAAAGRVGRYTAEGRKHSCAHRVSSFTPALQPFWHAAGALCGTRSSGQQRKRGASSPVVLHCADECMQQTRPRERAPSNVLGGAAACRLSQGPSC